MATIVTTVKNWCSRENSHSCRFSKFFLILILISPETESVILAYAYYSLLCSLKSHKNHYVQFLVLKQMYNYYQHFSEISYNLSSNCSVLILHNGSQLLLGLQEQMLFAAWYPKFPTTGIQHWESLGSRQSWRVTRKASSIMWLYNESQHIGHKWI